MKSKSITRSEAKILFNKVLNSGKYKSKTETIKFLVSCGYPENIASQITVLTHDPNKLFLYHMTQYEEIAINIFKRDNNLLNVGRLHDSIVFIKSDINPFIYEL